MKRILLILILLSSIVFAVTIPEKPFNMTTNVTELNNTSILNESKNTQENIFILLFILSFIVNIYLLIERMKHSR